MGRIISAAEEQGARWPWAREGSPRTRQEALAMAAADVGEAIGARALVAFTVTGSAARRLASHRCAIPLLAFTPEPAVRSQLSLTWGVETFVVPMADLTDEMVAQVDRALLELGRGSVGDQVVIVAGSPPGRAGTTNMMRVHQLGSF
jgi:pyruvate kinase